MIDNTWKPTDDRFVGYIDIMGFKDMVARLKHEEIYEMMKKIDESKKLIERVRWDNKDNLITTTTYSDSIMIYSKDSSIESMDHFASSVASLTDRLFKNQIPHKGAFAFGRMTLDMQNSIFFGQPLIDAYLLQEELNFYGMVGHATAEKEFDRKNLAFVVKTLCYFKNGTSEHITIAPMHATSKNQEQYLEQYNALMESVYKLRYITSGSLRKYIENTESYLKAIDR